uniref:Uncharacterized protein n=1 Tax=Kwoniella bestiolae CBS 10118 TaxID=1296100 RepID=A0A1B9FTT7_9TREE|nr:hypothetical protein I302_07816 [Kwoniella bestiolae CBS 10118]OCF22172.1 hypothetical protein I302_07816 [Kwoniella bestiolae CBS 10118]
MSLSPIIPTIGQTYISIAIERTRKSFATLLNPTVKDMMQCGIHTATLDMINKHDIKVIIQISGVTQYEVPVEEEIGRIALEVGRGLVGECRSGGIVLDVRVK